MVFSGFLAALFLGSAVVFLPPCTGKNAPVSASALNHTDVQISAYQRTECPSGGHRGVWAAMVAFQFITFVGYTVHFLIAMAVWRGLKEYDAGVRAGQVIELEDEEEKRRREEEARKRWREMQGNL